MNVQWGCCKMICSSPIIVLLFQYKKAGGKDCRLKIFSVHIKP